MEAKLKTAAKIGIVLGIAGWALGACGVLLAAQPEVAYVEEITVFPDGTQQVQGYRPQETQTPSAPPSVPRGLSSVEKQELDRLEDDYAHGRIGESEYFARRNEILKALGGNAQNNLFNSEFEF